MKTPASCFLKFQRPTLVALVLSGVTFAVFGTAIGYDFINYDDNLYVFENEQVDHGLTWNGLSYAFRTIDGGSWMPLTWLSLMLDSSLFGMWPQGFHLTNVLLHSASAGLLLLALQRLTKQLWPSAMVAALFALHPMRLQSVVWIAERKDVLSVFFWMLGILAYARHVERPSARRMAWVVVCLLLGIMAKPVVVSFPLILLLLDFWPLRRAGDSVKEFRENSWRLVKEKIPLAAVCVGGAAATIWSQSIKGGIVAAQFPLHLKLLRVAENVSFYCGKFILPTDLAIVYRVQKLDFLHAAAMGAMLIAVSVFVLRRACRWPWLAVGWLWFLFTLAPVAGFFRIGHIAVADHYSYLPTVGLAVMGVWSGVEIASRWPPIRTYLVGASWCWLLLCVLMTWADLPRWQSNFAVFESAYRRGAHYLACDQLGSMLYAQGELEQSITVCTRGLEDNPRFRSLYNTRGGAYYELSELDRAMADFDRAIEIDPEYAPTYFNRALVYIQRKQFVEARAAVRKYRSNGGTEDTSKLNIPH